MEIKKPRGGKVRVELTTDEAFALVRSLGEGHAWLFALSETVAGSGSKAQIEDAATQIKALYQALRAAGFALD